MMYSNENEEGIAFRSFLIGSSPWLMRVARLTRECVNAGTNETHFDRFLANACLQTGPTSSIFKEDRFVSDREG